MKSFGIVSSVILLGFAQPAAADEGDPWDERTMAVQTTAGVGGLLAGGALLGGIGLGIGKAVARDDTWSSALVGGAIGVIVGGAGGVFVSVQLTGDAKDGTGWWWGTALGAVVGAGATVGLLQFRRQIPTAGLLMMSGALLVGPPIVGYHLSAEGRATTPRQLAFPLMAGAF